MGIETSEAVRQEVNEQPDLQMSHNSELWYWNTGHLEHKPAIKMGPLMSR